MVVRAALKRVETVISTATWTSANQPTLGPSLRLSVGHCQVEQSDQDLRRCVLVNPQVYVTHEADAIGDRAHFAQLDNAPCSCVTRPGRTGAAEVDGDFEIGCGARGVAHDAGRTRRRVVDEWALGVSSVGALRLLKQRLRR